jgi:uncharacterized protein YggT (Ycf19 family)
VLDLVTHRLSHVILMGIVDFILNLAGLLLWLNWRSIRFDPLVKRKPATLMGTLRPASAKKHHRWHLLAFIAGLLFFRAVIYWWLGSSVWVGKLDLGVTVLSFRSDWFLRILVFSFFSFGLTLGVFYVGLLMLSLLSGPEPIHTLVKVPLGRVDGWPRWAKILMPFAVAAICWWLASWLLVWLQILPPTISVAQRLEQSLVIGLGSYLVWKFPVATLLALHLLNSYIYFGKHPFWKYVNVTAQTLLSPLKLIPLRIGKVDFAPVLGIALVFFAAEVAGRGLVWLYTKLPF